MKRSSHESNELGPQTRRNWLVTGAAGFIGGHLAETLLRARQTVTGLDDFSSGRRERIKALKTAHPESFRFIEGDIRDPAACRRACEGTQIVLHHAAIGSVVKSVEDPAFVDGVNTGGFLNVLTAAAQAGARRIVYASSSAVYGDGPGTPRREDECVDPLSPYAVGKYACELHAAALALSLNIETVGLRYFNIYGPGQDPQGAYAAVIPKWLAQLRAQQSVEIYGDGETVRDFCYVGDAVQANILAALGPYDGPAVYNVGSGTGTTLNALYTALAGIAGVTASPVHKNFRAADIRVSCADIEKIRAALGFVPSVSLEEGLRLLAESA